MQIIRIVPHLPTTLIRSAVLLIALCHAPAFGQTTGAADTALGPFGIGGDGTNNRSAQANASWMPQMAAIGIRSHRTIDSAWWTVEGQKQGQWDWTGVDSQLTYLEGLHIQAGAILAGPTPWDKVDAPGSLPVKSIPEWSTYVFELTKHIKGRVHYIETWNEPPNFTGRGQTPADYAKIVVASYDAIKAADPTCQVGLAAKSVHINYMEQVIKAGAKDHFDYITLHPYEVLGISVDHAGAEPVYMSIVPTVRKMLAAQDPAKVNVPIMFTELGCDAGPVGKGWGKGPNGQAISLLKAYTMGIAQGVTCINWFEGRDGDSGPMGLIAADGKPRPACTAMAQLILHFGQHPTYLGWVLLNDKDYGFVFQGAKGTVLSTWACKDTTDHVDFGRAVQIVDPMTGTITSASTCDLATAPVFILDVPAAIVAQAKTNKTKPFPWGGDYTDAKSVSITMGEKNIEKGLHSQSAASVAADVIAYGGAARAGSVPGGNIFMVDPNFLSYTSTPIRITAVVRRDAANNPATITVEYESTSGFKKTAAYEVPDNTDWHTATWDIDDSQFVNMWGFNFSLSAGRYYIQSVTVTKRNK